MIESNKNQKSNRIVTPSEKSIDKSVFSNALRPEKLEDYVWQESIKKHLSVAISSSKIRKEPLDHILFYWPPWLWKTTLSNIISNEMWWNLRSTSWPAIEKQSDLISILSNIEEWDILFIDEIHRIKPQIEEILYTAMEDFTIDIMVWSGTWAQSVKLPLKNFTLIWATAEVFPEAVHQAISTIKTFFEVIFSEISWIAFSIHSLKVNVSTFFINYFCKCVIQRGVIFLHLGLLSIKPICNRYGSTTSSIVASSSQIEDAIVLSQTGHQEKLFKIKFKYFLSK